MDSGWKGLALFWAAILAITAGGAGALEVLGPPPPARLAMPVPAPPIAKPRAVPAPPAAPGAIRTPDTALLEPAPDYPDRFLPRKSSDGRASMSFYAHARDPADKRPAVAMLVVGMGQSDADSLAASATLPGAVALGFSPYTANPDALLADTRQHGHEYLVTLPMESQGFPLNDSGPHALLTGADPAVNARNLEWILSRMQGEVGITGASDGLRGERFASAGTLFGAVQDQLAARGLLYVDPRPGAPARPGTVVATMVVDDPPDRASIDAKLAQLEQRARDGEHVLGLAGPLRPVTVERIAAWARGLDARGIALTPVSSLVPAP
jgi:polysaccharide deacetylase 2 family uncharacterized protein YibQ